jgi:hypothetical protein
VSDKFFLVVALLCLAVGAGGCAQSGQSQQPETFADAVGCAMVHEEGQLNDACVNAAITHVSSGGVSEAVATQAAVEVALGVYTTLPSQDNSAVWVTWNDEQYRDGDVNIVLETKIHTINFIVADNGDVWFSDRDVAKKYERLSDAVSAALG